MTRVVLVISRDKDDMPAEYLAGQAYYNSEAALHVLRKLIRDGVDADLQHEVEPGKWRWSSWSV